MSPDLQGPAARENKYPRASVTYYSLLIVAYGSDVDICYKELVSDLYLKFDSDKNRKNSKSKRVILSQYTGFSSDGKTQFHMQEQELAKGGGSR